MKQTYKEGKLVHEKIKVNERRTSEKQREEEERKDTVR
jgi:hypothetical protein